MLTGNPCTDYEGYREYVISTLPQIKELDMVEILRSERIKSLQVYARAKGDVIRGYENYKRIREDQIRRYREKEELKIAEITEVHTFYRIFFPFFFFVYSLFPKNCFSFLLFFMTKFEIIIGGRGSGK